MSDEQSESESVHLGVKLPEELKQQLEQMASEAGGRSVSSLVRELIARAWAERERRLAEQQGAA